MLNGGGRWGPGGVLIRFQSEKGNVGAFLGLWASLISRCFSGGSDGEEFALNAGDLGSISGLRRSPGEGKRYPLQYSGLENTQPMGLQRVGHD